MTGSPPLVSVALATYNGARYLREQLDSIYAQTWPNLEVVAADDASADGTAGILEEYARRQGLHYEVNPRRLGIVKNFERAISLCRGEYVALSDQDDLWKPSKLERLIAGIGDATLAYCNVQETLDGTGEARIETAHEPIYRFIRDRGTGKPTHHLLAENWVVCHSLLFRRELIRYALPIPESFRFPDGWLALVASKLGGIRYLDEPLQTYRRHPGSLTYQEGTFERGGGLRRVLGREFQEAWRQRCAAETARLRDALELPLLDGSDRRFIRELLAFYRSGLSRGLHLRAAVAGIRVARYHHTSYRNGQGWKLPLRAVLGGM